MNRRSFLQLAASLTGGSAVAALTACTADPKPSAASSAVADTTSARAAAIRPIGVQLYTVRTLLANDFVGTIEQLAGMGYQTLEFAGYYDQSSAGVGALLKRLQLAAPSAHCMPADIRERPQALIDRAQALGHRYLVCAYLQEKDRGSLDAYRRIAELLNTFGQRCADAGVQLAYHNHDFEFAALDGTVPYDLLLSATEDDLVQMEADVYWMHAADVDPVAYFRKYPGRFPLWHLKDRTASGAMAPVGEGTIDFGALFSHATTAGLQYGFVEHDNPSDPLASLRASMQHLQGLLP
ncbi:sugar phosphate isomerase/epimerase family protein [Salisaeta longa]|uniref:sugar phosphate isomerase/epimerase family protein n=1 Tax=Salisaeta longa TaxID=503170 RepID=UPI0003B5CE67|nr:sugar phosphate isomerase/epimerase [Salisaeta longa]